MPRKTVKLSGGRTVDVYAVLLPNGNLVIPARAEHDRTQVVWKEVKKGTSDHKRWWPVREKGLDPRKTGGQQ